LGFVRNDGNHIELELFIAGKSVQEITINHLICVDDGCMSKSGFNKEYLNESYPDDILQNILLGQTIYDAKELVKTADGFEQQIKDVHVEIAYKVTPHVIEFKDKKNRIIFIIKDTEQR
jgi:gamma-glutamylcysteine synthetase